MLGFSTGSTTVIPTQQTVKEAFTKTQPYDKKGKQWNELTNAVTYCIAKDSLAINIVERTGFEKMVKVFDNRYELPSRNYFSRTALPALYDSTRERVVEELCAANYFSATTDMWSSIGAKLYISYMIHFIDHQWNLKNKCLQTQKITQQKFFQKPWKLLWKHRIRQPRNKFV